MKTALVIAVAGAVGALARHYFGRSVQVFSGSEFPWGTLLVNLLGCLAFGLFVGLAEQRIQVAEATKHLVLTGFLGAFTTFSTYGFHTAVFLQEGHWSAATANILLSNIGGIALVLGGLYLGRGF